jgi:hypothetical protein
MDVQLQNGLTVRAIETTHSAYPRRWVMVTFALYPTPTVAFAETPDLLRQFAVQYHEDNAGQLAYVNAIIGKSAADIKTEILSQWAVYQGDPTNYPEPQLKTLFDYIDSVGVAP